MALVVQLFLILNVSHCYYRITRKFFNIIRNVYLNDEACVKASGIKSMPFDIDVGVRQGCILSPLFFNIFYLSLTLSKD